jgi:DMSO/TMAO reductase YedYZ molybdopterin-dependent catalytic subunit
VKTALRVQRVPETWPVVHLEDEIPSWSGLVVDGLVDRPLALRRDDLEALGVADHEITLHCVWGWSRSARFRGVLLGDVLALAGTLGSHAIVTSAAAVYSSCLPLAHAREGLLAWDRDGQALSPEAGGPLRFLAPPGYWAYKGVKWAARITIVDRFLAGFWESRVADPLGRIPKEVILP